MKEPEGVAFYSSDYIGKCLRLYRSRAGFSLRELEERSGVSHSEIFKIETGVQDCRLESYVRICAAMGLVWGEILDKCVTTQWEVYYEPAASHQLIRKLESLGSELAGVAHTLKFNFAMAGAVASQLVHCSRPIEVANSIIFPNEILEQRFAALAGKLQSAVAPFDRLSILNHLENEPVEALVELKIFSGMIDLNKITPDLPKNTVKQRALWQEIERFAGFPFPLSQWRPDVE